MNISKSSWHYRLLNQLDFINSYTPESLCSYFWKVVICLILGPVAAAMALFVLTMPLWWSFTDVPWGLAAVVGAFEVAGLSFLLCVTVSERHEEEVLAGTREIPKIVIPKPPSLFREWLRAKHRQVCPLIKFTSDV